MRGGAIGALLLSVLAAGPGAAADLTEGEVYRCPGAAGGVDITVWVGRLGIYGAMAPDSPLAFQPVAHLQMRGADDPDLPVIRHAPIARFAMAECTLAEADAMAVDADGFEDGYRAYAAAVAAQGAGIFMISPAVAYRSILAGREHRRGD